MTKDFHIDKKIYYHDTDCGGVVYYANYLKFLEEGRTEYLASQGLSMKDLVAKGIIFPVVHVEVDYKAPARYQDTIQIYTTVAKIGTSSVHFSQKIAKEGVTLIEAKTVWACVGNDFKVKPIPSEIKRVLSK